MRRAARRGRQAAAIAAFSVAVSMAGGERARADEEPVGETEPGVAAVFHPADLVRIDVGGSVQIGGEGLPVQLAFQVSPYLDLALRSGVTLGEGRPAMPLGLALGCTLPFGRGGYAVVTPSITWPRFVGAEGAWPGPIVLEVALSLVTP